MTDSQDHTPAPHAEILISLGSDAAVVLLDLLGRMDDPELDSIAQTLEHPAERASLWTLRAALEVAVGERLSENYDTVLDEARATLVARLEGK